MTLHLFRKISDFVCWEAKALRSLSLSDQDEFFRLVEADSLSRLECPLLLKILLCVAITLVVLLLQQQYADGVAALYWGGAMLLMTFGRIILYFVYFLYPAMMAGHIRWFILLENVALGFTALGFSSLPLLFWPAADISAELMILCIVVIYAGWSVDQSLGFSRIAILHSFITLAPTICFLLFMSTRLEVSAGILAIFFFLYLCRRIDVLVRNRAKLILEKMRFRKERLAVTATSREAARIKKANSELLAATSHDLRQPMHAARLFISMLETADPQDMTIRKDLHDKINLAFNSMESMLDSLLNFSYLKSGKSQIEKQSFELADICANLCQEFSGFATEQGVTLKLISSSLRVETDRLWLERLLRNLIANAIKYAPGKKVLVGARSKGGFVHIQIFDTGPGMSTSELEKMFDEFQSFNKENTPSAGSLGLGLAIVSRIVQLLGLEIRVQSDVGIGTRFTVIVPRVNTEKNEHEKHTPAQA